jgi:uncharacterized repeat protein (TIGR03847 family)
MSESFDLNPVDRITSGAVGEPGDRTFYIQARKGDRLVTLLCEKQQVEALATTLERLLDAMPEVEDEGTPVADEDLDLEEPLIPEWRVGPMGIELDEERDMIILILQEAVEIEGEEEEEEDAEPAIEGANARLVATRAQMRALAEQSATVVAGGRPRCRLCGFPLDPVADHICPALNGHRTPESP